MTRLHGHWGVRRLARLACHLHWWLDVNNLLIVTMGVVVMVIVVIDVVIDVVTVVVTPSAHPDYAHDNQHANANW